MRGILRLKPEVIARIAAGEVIESPLSAIKELIENSLDAGASKVDVKVISDEFLSFSVRDNGCGMRADEIKLSVERYTTSKIEDEEGLLSISTYGFRGEALFSIASVSRLIIRSAVKDGEGYECYFEGGVLKGERPLSMPRGTVVEVYDLFYNSPVRRRFLRGRKPFNYGIIDLLFKYKLANPDRVFTLRDNKGEILKLEDGDPIMLFYQIFGYTNEILNFEFRRDDIEVKGIFTLPEKSPPYSKIYFIVNRRPVSPRVVRTALQGVFGRAIEKGRMPSGILYLNLSPSLVDVNVHPGKLEVRFMDEDKVVDVIADGISEGLKDRTKTLLSREGVNKPRQVVGAPKEFELREEVLPYRSVKDFRILGPIWNEFLLIERGEELIFIDIHAAHEKLIYDRISEEYVSGGIESILLLTPLIINVGIETLKKIVENKEYLEKFGFIIDEFGEREICVRGYPAFIGEDEVEKVLFETLRAIDERLDDGVIRCLADIACKRAVKAGEPLSLLEIETLIAEVGDMKGGAYCPHGRPVLYLLPKSELEKWLRRR